MAERKYAWPARAENTLIGKDIPRIDGVAKASGQAKYTADINTKGTLFAKLVTCPLPAAKVKKIDVEAAKKMPGVKAVHLFKKEGDEIRWEGELLVAIAAERIEQAEDAIAKVVAEYDPLPFYVDEADVKAAEKAGRSKELGKNTKGDVKAALEKAHTVHKGFYGISTISHMCLEPHGSHCEWKGNDLEAHLSTQNVSGTPGQFAEPLGVDRKSVV